MEHISTPETNNQPPDITPHPNILISPILQHPRKQANQIKQTTKKIRKTPSSPIEPINSNNPIHKEH